MPNGSIDQHYKDFGATLFEGSVLSLFQVAPDGSRFYASATYINEGYAITSAHLVKAEMDAGFTFQVARGTNANSPNNLTNVESVLIHPDYNGNSQATPDIAILKLAEPLPGIPAVIGSVASGQKTTSAGFGYALRPDYSLNQADGFLRGWEAESNRTFGVWSESLYQATRFGISSLEITLNGKNLSGDSGGAVYYNGMLVGLNTGQIGNADEVGASVFLTLATQQTWIQQNTAIPEPTTAALVVSLASALMLKRQRRLRN